MAASVSNVVVLDSWAVMSYFQGEPSSHVVKEILITAQGGKKRLLMTVVNAGEVWYSYARRASEDIANERIRQLKMTGVEFVAADWDLTMAAARFKARNAIAYADCFAAALAKQENARLLTGDPEFRKLENEISITWL